MSGEPDMSFEPDTADLRKADESDGIVSNNVSTLAFQLKSSQAFYSILETDGDFSSMHRWQLRFSSTSRWCYEIFHVQAWSRSWKDVPHWSCIPSRGWSLLVGWCQWQRRKRKFQLSIIGLCEINAYMIFVNFRNQRDSHVSKKLLQCVQMIAFISFHTRRIFRNSICAKMEPLTRCHASMVLYLFRSIPFAGFPEKLSAVKSS